MPIMRILVVSYRLILMKPSQVEIFAIPSVCPSDCRPEPDPGGCRPVRGAGPVQHPGDAGGLHPPPAAGAQ